MERTSVSPVAAVVAVIAVIGIGAATYYLGSVLPSGQTTTAVVTAGGGASSSTSSTTSSLPSTSISSSSSSVSTVASSASTSSSSQSSTTTSSSQKAHLQILAAHLSHTLGGNSLAARCSSAAPPQGASYVEVTDNGTAPAEVTRIDIGYVEMMTSSGSPTGTCVVAVGVTEYVTLSGIGGDPASAGALFSVSLITADGDYAYVTGSFG